MAPEQAQGRLRISAAATVVILLPSPPTLSTSSPNTTPAVFRSPTNADCGRWRGGCGRGQGWRWCDRRMRSRTRCKLLQGERTRKETAGQSEQRRIIPVGLDRSGSGCRGV
ncbi:unnamed protein product [Linum tenue]|uniref:Secreted protein n=1 Tax=Linum tenue TaxID=586396 RepID=A0AAV0HD47_9ROSI|nr:unnamed protein product [Linum tenue]